MRGSADIGQDADNIFRLQKVKPKKGETLDTSEGEPVDLLILKQRNGQTGRVRLTFLKPYTRFESASKISDEDVPTE